jgi:hypothetical protein
MAACQPDEGGTWPCSTPTLIGYVPYRVTLRSSPDALDAPRRLSRSALEQGYVLSPMLHSVHSSPWRSAKVEERAHPAFNLARFSRTWQSRQVTTPPPPMLPAPHFLRLHNIRFYLFATARPSSRRDLVREIRRLDLSRSIKEFVLAFSAELPCDLPLRRPASLSWGQHPGPAASRPLMYLGANLMAVLCTRSVFL